MRLLIILSSLLFFTSCENSDPVSSTSIDSIAVGQNVITTHHSSSDGYVINSVRQQEGDLVFNVSYGGGCQRHNFRLMADDAILKTMPPGIRVFLYHNDNDDICEAWLTDDILFNLGELQEKVDGIKDRIEFSIYVVSPEKEDSVETIVEINLLVHG